MLWQSPAVSLVTTLCAETLCTGHSGTALCGLRRGLRPVRGTLSSPPLEPGLGLGLLDHRMWRKESSLGFGSTQEGKGWCSFPLGRCALEALSCPAKSPPPLLEGPGEQDSPLEPCEEEGQPAVPASQGTPHYPPCGLNPSSAPWWSGVSLPQLRGGVRSPRTLRGR